MHRAFLKTALKYKDNQNISFFTYEDFPYIQNMSKQNEKDYLNTIYNKKGISFVEYDIKLDAKDIEKKEKALALYISQVKAFETLGSKIEDLSKNFSQTRCQKNYSSWDACEVIYKLNFN